MSAFGAIKEGTELEDYDTKYSFFRALGYTSLGITGGTILVGAIGFAAYLKYWSKYSKPINTKETSA